MGITVINKTTSVRDMGASGDAYAESKDDTTLYGDVLYFSSSYEGFFSMMFLGARERACGIRNSLSAREALQDTDMKKLHLGMERYRRYSLGFRGRQPTSWKAPS